MYFMYMYIDCENLVNIVLSLLNLYLHILWILDFKYILLLLLLFALHSDDSQIKFKFYHFIVVIFIIFGSLAINFLY